MAADSVGMPKRLGPVVSEAATLAGAAYATEGAGACLEHEKARRSGLGNPSRGINVATWSL